METYTPADDKKSLARTDEAYPIPAAAVPDTSSDTNRSPNTSNNNSSTSNNINAASLAEASLLKEKGNAKFNKGEYTEARHYYDQALTLIKDLKRTTPEERISIASLYCNRGATHGKEHNVEGALRDYDSAIRTAPDYGKAYSRKFKVLAAHGKLREAKVLLETAVLKVLGDKGLLEDLRKTKQIVDGIQSVKTLLQLRNYTEAKQLGDVLMKTTDNPEAVLLSAEADAAIGLIDSAMDKCTFALKNDPSSAIGMKTSGYISLLGGNVEAAILAMKESLKYDPNNTEAKDLFRFCRKVQSDLVEGRACIAKAAEGGSRTVLKKAVDCFSSSIDDGSLPPKAPLLCMMRIERSETELLLMHYQPALSDARLAIEVNPTSVRAWVVKAESYIATGRAAEVRDELLEARRTWARGLDRIKEVCVRAALECKIHEADKELRAMVAHVSVDKKEVGTRPQDGLSRSDHRDNRQRDPGEKASKNMRRQNMDSAVNDKSGDSRQQQPRRASTARRSSTTDARPAVGRRNSVGDRPATDRPISGDRPQHAQRRPPENGRTGSVERRPPENGRTASMERRPVESGRSNKGDHQRVNSVGNDAKQQPQKRKPLSEADARRRVSMI
jgi:tetratricopeptide (TPR) repeat protein